MIYPIRFSLQVLFVCSFSSILIPSGFEPTVAKTLESIPETKYTGIDSAIEFHKLPGLVLIKTIPIVDKTGKPRPDLPPVEVYHQKAVTRTTTKPGRPAVVKILQPARKVVKNPDKADGSHRLPTIIEYPSQEVGFVVDTFHSLPITSKNQIKLLHFYINNLPPTSDEFIRTKYALSKLQNDTMPLAAAFLEEWQKKQAITKRLLTSPKELSLLTAERIGNLQAQATVYATYLKIVKENIGGIEITSPDDVSALLGLARAATDHILGELSEEARRTTVRALKGASDSTRLSTAFALAAKASAINDTSGSTLSSPSSATGGVGTMHSGSLSVGSAETKSKPGRPIETYIISGKTYTAEGHDDVLS